MRRRSRSCLLLHLSLLAGVAATSVSALISCGEDDCAASSSCEGMQPPGQNDGGPGEGGPPQTVGGFSFDPIAAQPKVMHDSSQTVALIVVREPAQTEDIAVTVANLPAGVTVEPAKINGADSKGELVVKVAASAKQGAFDVTVEGTTASGKKASTKLSLFVRGKPGTIDTTFGVDGKQKVLGPSPRAPQAIVGPNDTIYLAGECPSTPTRGTCVARLSADGTVDAAYGGLISPLKLPDANSIALDSKGRLVVGGGPGVPIVARFTDTGQPDIPFGDRDMTSTNPNFDPPSQITGVLIGPDDVVYVLYFGGNFGVVRQLLNTGQPSGWGAAYSTSAARWLGGTGTDGASRPSGFVFRGSKLVVGGVWENGGIRGFGLTQMEAATGAPDYSFEPSFSAKWFTSSTAVIASPRTVVILPDGRIVVGGATGGPGQSLAMFTAVGAADTTFGNGTGVATFGFGSATNLTDVVREGAGTFIIGKSDGLARLLPNGVLDPSFGSAGVSLAVGGSVALQSDGRIIVGSLESGAFFVTRVWN